MTAASGVVDLEQTPSGPARPRAVSFWVSLFFFKMSLDIAGVFLGSRLPLNQFTIQLSVSGIKLLESYLILVVVAALLPKHSRSVSTLLVWLLTLLAYVPILTVYPLANESRPWTYMVSLFWIIFLMLVRIPFRFPMPRAVRGGTSAILVMVGLISAYSIVAVLSMGVSISLDLNEGLYQARSAYYYSKLPLLEYVFNWAAFVINPLVMMWALFRKKYVILMLPAALQLLLFFRTGNKIYGLVLMLVVTLHYLLSKRRLTFQNLACGASGLLISGMATNWLFGDLWVSVIFTNRLLILPAMISFDYYDFFSVNPLVYLSHGLLKAFVDYPYPLPPSFWIGKLYYGSEIVAANTGMMGDAYMNFGALGLAALLLALVTLVKLIDSIAAGKNEALVVGAVLMSVLFSINAGFLTSILTGGLGIALVIVYLMPATRNFTRAELGTDAFTRGTTSDGSAVHRHNN